MSGILKPFISSAKAQATTPSRLHIDNVISYEVGPETPEDTGTSGFTILFVMTGNAGGRNQKVVTWRYKVEDERNADLAALDALVNNVLVP